MKFGKVEDATGIDFTLPPDHSDTAIVLGGEPAKEFEVRVGCSQWNKQELKGFYPRGTKDELTYYASQFSCIEANGTFYRIYPESRFEKWYERTPSDFIFYPKMVRDVSHTLRLGPGSNVWIDQFFASILHLREKLGMVFIQLPSTFTPKDYYRVQQFVYQWPTEISLAMEFRHPEWFADKEVADKLHRMLVYTNISQIITDTAGRRDTLHMRLTTKHVFIRYVSTDDAADEPRLDNWVERLHSWKSQGIEKVSFFVHQHHEVDTPLLARYMIQQLNAKLNTKIKIPYDPRTVVQGTLF